MNEDTAICQLCSDRAHAEFPIGDLGAHFRLFHPDAGVTEETIAQAEIKWVCPYLDHPEHDPNACLHCATDEQLERED